MFGLILFCASSSLGFERGGLVFACLLRFASVASLGSAIHSGWSSSFGRYQLRCFPYGLRPLLSSGCSPVFARLLRSARLLGCALLGLAPWLVSSGCSASPRLRSCPPLASRRRRCAL